VAKDPAAPHIELLDYDGLFASRRLARAAYVFTDLDRLAPWDLELAAAVHRDLTAASGAQRSGARQTRFALLPAPTRRAQRFQRVSARRRCGRRASRCS
jgi:hypothetical protein